MDAYRQKIQDSMAHLRERAAEAARSGRRPSEVFVQEDLEWAFAERPEELLGLEEIAQQSKNETARQRAAMAAHRSLESLTDQIEREMINAENAKRRTRAETEARRRLHLESGDQSRDDELYRLMAALTDNDLVFAEEALAVERAGQDHALYKQTIQIRIDELTAAEAAA